MKRKITILTIFFLLFNITFGMPAFSSDNNVQIEISISKECPENESFYKYEKVFINIDFKAEKINPGDVITIELPVQFEKNNLKFDVFNKKSNDIVASGQVDGNILTVTFNDNINSLNDVSGTISLTRTIKLEYYNKDGIDLKFEYLGKTITKHIQTNDTDLPNNINFFKFSYTGGENDKDLFWGLTINPDKKEFNNVIIEDKLGEGQTFIKESFNIIKNVEFNNQGDRVPSADEKFLNLDDFKHEINDTSFTINLGNINQGYCITYQVRKTKNLDEYTNWSSMKADGADYTYEASRVIENGSGVIGGIEEKGTIKLKKVDKENKSLVLKGAKFQLIDDENNVVGEYTTNEEGIIEVSDIILDKEYHFIEIEAPDGYKLDDSKIRFKLNKDEKENILEICNSKESDEPDVSEPPNKDPVEQERPTDEQDVSEPPKEESKEPERPKDEQDVSEPPKEESKEPERPKDEQDVSEPPKEESKEPERPKDEPEVSEPPKEEPEEPEPPKDEPEVPEPPKEEPEEQEPPKDEPIAENEPQVVLYNKSNVPKTGRKSMIPVYAVLALSAIQIIRMTNKKH